MSGNSYPLLYTPESEGTMTVAVGGEPVTREAGLARWTYSECGPPPYCFVSKGTEVRSTMLAGIGQVALEATYSETDVGTPVRRDTIRATLVGAEVGGVVYGDIAPVATSDSPGPSALALRAGPNPARGAVTVWVLAARSAVDLALYDALGRRVQHLGTVSPGPVRVDVSGLPAGLYTIRATATGAAAHTRVVVAR